MEKKIRFNETKSSLNLLKKSGFFILIIGGVFLILSMTMDETEKNYDKDHYARTGILLYKWNRTKPLFTKIGVGVMIIGGIVIAISNRKKKLG